MGAKQTRTGQQLFLYAACFVIVAMGCLHWPPPQKGEQQLLEARKRFDNGDYNSALEINQRVLAQFSARLADQSLFQIGLIYLHPDNPSRNVQKSMEAFQRIIDRYPASHLRQDAELWLNVLDHFRLQEGQIQLLTQRKLPLENTIKMQKREIYRLQDQLEKLKRVDLKMEERKRQAIPEAEELKEKRNGKNSGS